MPRITVIQKGKSLVNVALEGRPLALPNNSRRDATCTVEDGIVTGPPDLLEKIQDGTISVLDWHGHRIEGMEQADEEATEITEEQSAILAEAKPKSEAEAVKVLADAGKPVAKDVKAKPPVKVTPPANVGNLLQQPNEVE